MNQDVKTALKSMWSGLTECLYHWGTVAGALAVMCFIGFIIGYCLYHFFFQSLTVFAMMMLCVWFWIELGSAREIRLREEQQENYWAEKRKPMHEYKEQE